MMKSRKERKAFFKMAVLMLMFSHVKRMLNFLQFPCRRAQFNQTDQFKDKQSVFRLKHN